MCLYNSINTGFITNIQSSGFEHYKGSHKSTINNHLMIISNGAIIINTGIHTLFDNTILHLNSVDFEHIQGKPRNQHFCDFGMCLNEHKHLL